MQRPIALTRSVPSSIVDCELTHVEREPIDLKRAAEEHSLYEKTLISLGCEIRRLPSLPDMPDSVFVEDTAVVLPELAIIARPGAESRRLEVPSVADALQLHRPLAFIESPATLDGGDVMRVGSTIYVGESSRTNTEGIRQLRALTSAYGYVVRPIRVSGCLHLKSAVTQVAEDVVLVNSSWVDTSSFESLHRIDVHPEEPFAANALLIGETIIYPERCDETRRRLENNRIDVRSIEMSELHKAEGGVTCCSILISTTGA
jgi:dimethylargininase